MDFKGTIELVIGVLVIGFVAWFENAHHAFIELVVGSFVLFLAWLWISSGLSNLWEVHKDKKSRRRRPQPRPGTPGVPPSVMHEGIQEPKQ